MSEKLLTLQETARRLALPKRTFYEKRAGLIAAGLQEVKIGSRPKYRESSLDKLITKTAEEGGSL